jgi:hypothetical protein
LSYGQNYPLDSIELHVKEFEDGNLRESKFPNDDKIPKE